MLRYRHRVLGFLCLLAAITYLDRVAISAPAILGACGNVCGGFVRDVLVKRLGIKWGRRTSDSLV